MKPLADSGKKHSGKYVAYYRVSTERQGRSGLGLEAQREVVAKYLNGGDWQIVGEFVEVESGRKGDRPGLRDALALCKKEKATLIVAKLDRLSRSVYLIAGLMESKVPFIVCDLPEANELTLHIMAAFAQHEARRIGERTRDALAAAKRRGQKLGSPDPSKGAALGRETQRRKAAEFSRRIIPIVQDIQTRGGATTLRGIAGALSARGVATSTGNATWHHSQVANLLRRI